MKHSYVCDEHVVHQEVVLQAKKKQIDESTLMFVASFFNAIKDPTRLKIVHALSLSDMCVCDIAATLSMSQSAISHQLRLLRESAIVKATRKGKMVYYSLVDNHVHTIISQAIAHYHE